MFAQKDLVVYGSAGVCEVVGVGDPGIDGIDRSRTYYTLQPVFSASGIIYTPVDNAKVAMRPVMTPKTARSLIDRIPDLELITEENSKQWEAFCKDAMRRCDSEACTQIVKTLYLRKKKRNASGRKSTAMDERYLHSAEEHLFGELAISLKKSRQEIAEHVLGILEEL